MTVPKIGSMVERLPVLASRGILHVAVVGIALLWLIPSVGLAVTSFRPRGDILSSGWWNVLGQPRFTLDNYTSVLGNEGVGQALLNSFIITVPSTVLPLLVSALAAFAFSWLRFPGRDWLFLGVLALMIVPIQVALVPSLQLFSAFGLTGSYVGIWLAHTAFGLPFAVFLLRNFFVQLPPDLLEAAQIDGATSLAIFRRVVVPLSGPAIASLAVFQFLWVWNDLLMALIFIQRPEQRPLTVEMSQLLSTYGQEFNLLSAASFILMIVPLIVFFSLQRYFVRGITAGAVK
jgi:alpha-glucoside transport system permease protein